MIPINFELKNDELLINILLIVVKAVCNNPVTVLNNFDTLIAYPNPLEESVIECIMLLASAVAKPSISLTSSVLKYKAAELLIAVIFVLEFYIGA